MTPDLCRGSRAAALLLLLGLTRTASAQVGYDPAHSPYRTLRYGQFIGVTGGYFNGDGGQIGVAPHQGGTLGLRYDFLGASTISVGLAATYGDLQRFIVDKTKSVETGRTGPFKQGTMFFEGIIQFNLTGGKSWHRIAPYMSAGLGVALAEKMPADTSGFTFRTKLALTPGIGARVFLSERLFLRLEARNTFWQVSYPAVYRLAPSAEPGKPPVITGSGKEWVPTGWYTVGLAYAFHRPF
jgi:hypothetical protein